NHRRVVRKIMEDIWHAPMRPIFQNFFRPQADGSIDLTSDGLSLALGGWGFRNKRVVEFNSKWAKLVHEIAACFEAETGVNPLREGIKKFFPGVRWQFLTRDGRQCCDDCKLPKLAGPVLHDELWATFTEPHAFLCLDCTQKRLGRPLTQADLTVCAFNAGWLSFDEANVEAMAFARGRQLLPAGPETG